MHRKLLVLVVVLLTAVNPVLGQEIPLPKAPKSCTTEFKIKENGTIKFKFRSEGIKPEGTIQGRDGNSGDWTDLGIKPAGKDKFKTKVDKTYEYTRIKIMKKGVLKYALNCNLPGDVTPTPSLSPTGIPTATSTQTNTPTIVATTITWTPSATSTSAPTDTATRTVSPTATNTETVVFVPSGTPTPTITPVGNAWWTFTYGCYTSSNGVEYCGLVMTTHGVPDDVPVYIRYCFPSQFFGGTWQGTGPIAKAAFTWQKQGNLIPPLKFDALVGGLGGTEYLDMSYFGWTPDPDYPNTPPNPNPDCGTKPTWIDVINSAPLQQVTETTLGW